MDRKTILVTLVMGLMIAGTILMKDGWLYLTASLMGLSIIGVIHFNRKKMLKLTKWAKTNPKKTQGLIAVLQIALLSLGLLLGYNLKELGYEISEITYIVFGAIMILGFLTVPFLAKRKSIVIPKTVKKHRLSYAAIYLSAFVMVITIGNRIGDSLPNSSFHIALQAADQAIFSDYESDQLTESSEFQGDIYGHNVEANSSELVVIAVSQAAPQSTSANMSQKSLKKARKAKKKAFRKKMRRILAGGTCALGILLTILLIGTTCAGICIIVGGANVIAGGSALGGVGLILLGALVATGSVLGIVKAVQMCQDDL